jgi:hypothetical protein
VLGVESVLATGSTSQIVTGPEKKLPPGSTGPDVTRT